MLNSLLSKVLPLADDPFPPTHKAGSEFEGFFIRLESHSGRSYSSSQRADRPSSQKEGISSSAIKSSPSWIPRLAPKSRNGEASTANSLRQLRQRRPRSSSASSSSSSAEDGPPSPTPPARRISRDATHYTDGKISPKTMLTDLDPVIASPESYLPRPSSSTQTSRHVRNTSTTLPTSSPGDLILVVCELQSAPVDQRICIYLRWIVHGEEEALHRDLHSPLLNGEKGGERLPANASRKAEGQSFEIIKYLPSWQLKVGRKAGSGSVQPFRINLSSAPYEAEGALEGGLGFVEVSADGNVAVDITLGNASRSHGKAVDTRVRLRTTKLCPWQPRASAALPMGTRGPEGWIQHLGALLPLHWYVHSTSAPATFSLEHVALPSTSADQPRGLQLDDAVAAGRGLLHIEKNWGHAFPSGWMWAHGASPLPDPSVPSSSSPSQPSARLSLAGGSILGLTAFLVGIHITDGEQHPPAALGPQLAVRAGAAHVHCGPGLRMLRDFAAKRFQLDVWDLTHWATVCIEADEHTFATRIPGPRKGGWTPAYCHHSYRCRARVTLRQRSVGSVVAMPFKAALRPVSSVKSVKDFWTEGRESGAGWKRFGWEVVARAEFRDRVALEFGGDFAK
ncbi:uncharacterized protein SRS1_14730 [Sporisorium reilianum f. sp. reilianum]|uniref:Uncharacterized protein n=1 Tax=Sporisorium reilianum f. sp. reilianum TaxID=72559 RepID=A0A2N8UGH5_9BASI|nr:uncharacterized protein SRS1_14730 [Sporisorium reilianum f. sp. reilianum]